MNKTILDNKTVEKITEKREGTVFNEIVYLTARAFIASRGEKRGEEAVDYELQALSLD